MRRLFALVTTKGKTITQTSKEVTMAFKQYQKTGKPTIKLEGQGLTDPWYFTPGVSEDKYFDLDDTPIRVISDGKNASAYTWSGHSYPPFKVLAFGRMVEKSSYDAVAKAYEDHLINKTIDVKEFHAVISREFGTQYFD